MNRKMKLVLGLAGLVGVTGAISGTATYAWFTTTRTASVTLTNVGVYGSTSNIKISYVTMGDGVKNAPTGGSNEVSSIAFTGATYNITPVSGNGAHFFMPKWVAGYDGYVSDGSATDVVNNVTSTGVYYYIQFGLGIKNENSVKTNIYLDYGTGITAATGEGDQATKNAQAAKATRAAFFDFGTTAPTEKLATTTSATETKYLLSSSTTETAAAAYYMDAATDYNSTTTFYGLTDVATAHPTSPANDNTYYDYKNNKKYNYTTVWDAGTTESDPKTNIYSLSKLTSTNINKNNFGSAALTAMTGVDAQRKLCTVEKFSTEYVVVSLWIEGTSDDCTNVANGGIVNATFNLAAFDDTATA